MPIILVTACDAANITAEAHTAGVNKIIPKPLFQSTLFARAVADLPELENAFSRS